MKPAPRLDESDLLERLRAGDEDAFAVLVDLHSPSLRRLARSFVTTDAAADELVQETWLALLSGIDAFEARSSLKTWLFRVCANRAKTRAGKDARSVPASSLAPEGVDAPAHDPRAFLEDGHWKNAPARWDDESPETRLLRREAAEAIAKALETLPPMQRAVVTLRDVDGLDSAEVCNVLELSETNQRVLLHRARVKLRAALEAYVNGVTT